MGWISDRHHVTGSGLNKQPKRNGSQKGPLRKILEIKTAGQSLFDRDWVVFECGHEGFATIGAVRGRCRKCKQSESASS